MTIREIARRCGVSRGTVDRVINGRGKVHPATEARILEMLEQVGYTKNIAGRALTVRKSAPVIGVILSSEGNPFFDEVMEGIQRAQDELLDYGVTVTVQTMRGYRTQTQLAHIEALEGTMSALVLHPINDARIVEKVNALAERGIHTVTVNSDLENSARLCYVGSDYVRGGQVAAGIVRLVTEGRAKLGIVTGVPSVLGHGQRLVGFEAYLKAMCPDIAILAHESAEDDAERAHDATLQMLRQAPEIDTLMVIAAGLSGVHDAVHAAGRAKDMRIFAFDNIPGTEAMMRAGLVKAVVCQQPFQQGYQAVRAAFDIILTEKPPAERLIMENQIKILENLAE